MSSELNESLAPWLAERAAEQAAAWEAKQARKVAERAAKKRRRDAGLVQRHARKLARLNPGKTL